MSKRDVWHCVACGTSWVNGPGIRLSAICPFCDRIGERQVKCYCMQWPLCSPWCRGKVGGEK